MRMTFHEIPLAAPLYSLLHWGGESTDKFQTLWWLVVTSLKTVKTPSQESCEELFFSSNNCSNKISWSVNFNLNVSEQWSSVTLDTECRPGRRGLVWERWREVPRRSRQWDLSETRRLSPRAMLSSPVMMLDMDHLGDRRGERVVVTIPAYSSLALLTSCLTRDN